MQSTMESAKEMFGTMMLSQSKERVTIRRLYYNDAAPVC